MLPQKSFCFPLQQLMGASLSTNVANTISEDVAKVIKETQSSCMTFSEQKQDISVGAGGTINFQGGRLEQSASVDMNCISKLSDSSELESNLKKEIAGETSSKIDGLAFGVSMATNVSNSVDNIVKDINIKQISKQVASNLQTQSISGGDKAVINVQGAVLSQQGTVIATMVTNALSKSKTVSDIQVSVDQRAKTVMIGLLSTSFLVVALIVGMIWFFAGGGKKHVKKMTEQLSNKQTSQAPSLAARTAEPSLNWVKEAPRSAGEAKSSFSGFRVNRRNW